MANPSRPTSGPNPPSNPATPPASSSPPQSPSRRQSPRVTTTLNSPATRAPSVAGRDIRPPVGAGGTAFKPSATPPSFFDRPLLSTIDRYVLGTFVKNYLISMLVLIGLYVVLDMVFNFDEFVKVSNREAAADPESASMLSTLRTVFDFYLFQSFRIFNPLAGIIPVVATAFTLVRMSRFNELAALLAAGVPLRRVAQPIILASFLVNGSVLMINQELIVPNLIDKLTRERGEADSHLAGRALQAMPVGSGETRDVLFAGQYMLPRETAPATMRYVYVLQKEPGVYTAEIAAEQATFDTKTQHWTLTNGRRTIYPSTPGEPSRVEPIEHYDGAVTPETIALFVSRGDFVDLLSTQRISELLSQNTSVGRLDLMRVRDSRWATYVLNVVLVLLTIPCVLTREPQQLRAAAGRVFVLIGACMATIFVTQNLAGQPSPKPELANTWPAIMAWLPIFIFAPISIWMLDRLKT